jgi:hypothetical protein
MPEPVAKLSLDTRSWGPASCEKCDEDVEDVILMSDATLVCAECRTPMQGGDFFDHFSEVFTSAAPMPKKKRS